MDTVKADKGYSGEVVVCAVYFAPIAGYVPSRSTIKYISKQREMEVWLAPIAGTRVLVPFRAQSPTPIGEAVLKATQFVSTRSSNARLRQWREDPLADKTALTLRAEVILAHVNV